MTINEFDDLTTEACIVYVNDCIKRDEFEIVEEVEFSKRHQIRMKKMFRDLKRCKVIVDKYNYIINTI